MNRLLQKDQLIERLISIICIILFSNTSLKAQENQMQRLSIYEKNRAYFYDNRLNRPVFLSGQAVWTSICTPKLWYSHSPEAFGEKYNNKEDIVLDPDKVIDYLALKGGNCCHLTTFYGHYPAGKTAGPIYYPWAKVDGQKKSVSETRKFDLLKFDEIYWQRFRHFIGLCESKNIYVILEVFPNLWGYPTSPLNPDNNISYTREDMPANRDWFKSVRGGSEKVLTAQKAFVTKVIQESLPFRNVIYLINNQYYSEIRYVNTPGAETTEEFFVDRDVALAWPVYWARFIKDIGKKNGESLLVSTMPQFHPSDSRLSKNFQWYIDEDLFDFVDAGWWRQHPFYQEYSNSETIWMDEFDAIPLRDRAALFARTIQSWNNYMVETNQLKPLLLSKNLYWDGVLRHSPWPLWLGLISGYTGSNPHEPMSRSYWNAPRYEPAADIAGYLHRFIRETQVEFWNMKVMKNVAYVSGQDAYVMANKGEEFVVYLVGESQGPLLIRLPEGEFIVDYYDPKTGQWIDTKLYAGKDATEIFIHKSYDEMALFIQKREKREAVTGIKFPSVIKK